MFLVPDGFYVSAVQVPYLDVEGLSNVSSSCMFNYRYTVIHKILKIVNNQLYVFHIFIVDGRQTNNIHGVLEKEILTFIHIGL